MRKHRGIGGYLQVSTGMSVYGIDIFVLEEQFEQATEIVTGFNGCFSQEQGIMDELDYQPEEEKDMNTSQGGNSLNRLGNRILAMIMITFVIYLIFVLSRSQIWSDFYVLQ